MKKINLVLFYIFFLIYEELVLSFLLFKTLPVNIWLISLLSIPIALILSFLSNIFNKTGNKIVTYIITVFFVILFGTQIVYYSMYESIISIYSIMHGGQVAEFMDVIIDMIIRNWYAILLFALPILILVILHSNEGIEFERMGWKGSLVKLLLIIVVQISGILCINHVNTNDLYSYKNLYYYTHVPKLTTEKMGFLTTLRLDFKRLLFGFNEDLEVKLEKSEMNYNELSEEEKEQYNITEIDFKKLISEEQDEQIKKIHNFIENSVPSTKNEYTGRFKDKNLIVIVAESFSSLAIRRDLTPNLYKLYSEGFQFENFYTPIFPVSTADGEYMTDTSLIPKEGVWSFKEIVGHSMPYSYANVLKPNGYSTNAYHNHTATYYNRDKYIKTMGYDSYLAVGNGLEKRMDTSKWPNSDFEMINATIDDYINNDRFLAYYMTVSRTFRLHKKNE